MEPRVKLREFIDAMDLPNQDWQSYLNRDTGEIVTVTDEDRALVDGETDLDDLPDWQREALTKAREALESNRFLLLPGSFELHEWSIMERFAQERGTPGNAMNSLIRFMAAARFACSNQRFDGWGSKKSGTASVIRRLQRLLKTGWSRTDLSTSRVRGRRRATALATKLAGRAPSRG
jgi:hypothetical protein